MSVSSQLKIFNEWNIIIIVANMISVSSQLQILQGGATESYTLGKNMGFSVVLLLFSMNKYMTFHESIAHLPNTFLGSAKDVTGGIVSMFPLFIGVAYMSTTQLYMFFRFRDVTYAAMTMWYNMQGDTVFDTLLPGSAVNLLYISFWCAFPLFFLSYIFNKIALAMVEDGYLKHKYRRQFDWLFITDKKIINTDSISNLSGNSNAGGISHP